MTDHSAVNLRALVLAAGKGTRMKSDKSKVVHEIFGKAIIQYIIDTLKSVPVRDIAVVAGEHNLTEIKNILGAQVEYIVQKEQKGTGHAVMVAEEWLKGNTNDVFVLVGDAPFITKNILRDLYNTKQNKKCVCTLLSSVYDNPPPYGRIVRDTHNNVMAIVEEKDATADQKKIKEVSSSHYCFDSAELLLALKEINNNNAQNEYYLPDVIKVFYNKGFTVDTLRVDDPFITFGINSPEDLEKGKKYLKQSAMSL